MRVYVFGTDRDSCISLANTLNEGGISAIIGAETSSSAVAAELEKSFDYAIMVSGNPIKAAIEANRTPMVRAAACHSQRILRSAIESGSNLLIFDSDWERSIRPAEALGRAGGPAAEREQPPRPATVQQRGQKRRERPKERAAEPERDNENYDDERGPREDGIMGRIRYAFGIE
jgi:hypothetical protein